MSIGRLGAGDTAIQPTIFDAKGDLLTATAADTPARIAVGNDGETLVADSSAATGLRWQGDYAAGKNKIINGDFAINQRAFTSGTTTGSFIFDRWQQNNVDGTCTFSAQTFTAGAAPVAGYEAANYARAVTTGQTATNALAIFTQRIEDVRTYAGQTITVSFWAQAGTATPSISIELDQQFGSGGSTRVTTFVAKTAITTSWVRYSATIAVPSISGKTIGTGSYLSLGLWVSAGTDFNARTSSLGIQSNTFNIWGVQIEAGSVATAFQTATGTLAGELAACQRYYYRTGVGSANQTTYGVGMALSSTTAAIYIQYPSTMRGQPTSLDYADLAISDLVNYTVVLTSLVLSDRNNIGGKVAATVASGLTQYRTAFLVNNNNVTGYLGFSAEL